MNKTLYVTDLSQPIVIVYVVTGLGTGGAETMLYQLLTKIDKQRFTPIVISLMDRGTFGDRIEKLGIAVHCLNMKQGMPTPSNFWQLIKLVRQIQPDILQGWMYHGNLAAYLASIFLLPKISVMWSIHHSIKFIELEKRTTIAVINLCANLSRFIDKIIFVSENSKAQHEAIGYTSTNSCVFPNGFDTSLFQPSTTTKASIRKELKLSDHTFVIGLFARYHPMKDHANFLKAAALLYNKFSNVCFLLAGTNVDSHNQVLNEQIQNLNLVNSVRLLGERHDIPQLIAALDILSLSSAFGEAFPLILGEAMSSAIPCVVTNIGDSASIVGNTGRVVPPQDAEALANAWQELIELGVEKREALGRTARKRILNSFSLQSVVTQYENLYESVLVKSKTKKSAFASN